jgi:RNA polymerase sigma-70 factor (ECF subfamily)
MSGLAVQADDTDDAALPAATLVGRAAEGDRGAEAALCRRFLPAVRVFARRRLRTPDAVAEFSQDVMLLFIEALRRGAVEDPARLGGFVLGICRNLALDRVRQRERREALWQQFGAAWTELGADPPAPEDAPSYEIIHLEDCLSRLSQRGRDVVRLAYAEARSHGEIAAQLATSEANARVLRHRTLHALRDCMAQRITWEATA